MGIKNLTKLLQDVAPESIKETSLKSMMGRKVAIDASMCIYQMLVAVRTMEKSGSSLQLTDENGNVTSHLQGIMNRTVKLVEHGVTPVWVFDGKPPDMKGGELMKRKEAREKAEQELKKAEETGTTEDVNKFNRRLVKMTTEHKEDCKKLLKLLGVPIVESPMEAEAQCASLAKEGAVWGVVTEDMDALTFGTPVLVRKLWKADGKKVHCLEIDYNKVLSGLELNREEFVDLCILMGCDYLDSIRGIGMKKSYELIKKHKKIENILEAIKDVPKYKVPEEFPFARARELFNNHEVLLKKDLNLKMKAADRPAVIQYMCTEKGFNEDRINAALDKLSKARKKGGQKRMDAFFKPTGVKVGSKRKPEQKKKSAVKGKNTLGKKKMKK